MFEEPTENPTLEPTENPAMQSVYHLTIYTTAKQISKTHSELLDDETMRLIQIAAIVITLAIAMLVLLYVISKKKNKNGQMAQKSSKVNAVEKDRKDAAKQEGIKQNSLHVSNVPVTLSRTISAGFAIDISEIITETNTKTETGTQKLISFCICWLTYVQRMCLNALYGIVPFYVLKTPQYGWTSTDLALIFTVSNVVIPTYMKLAR